MKIRINLNEDEKKYVSIYKQIKEQIAKGELKGDEKLPSKRQLSKTLNVSINTIMTSYEILLEEEYIYSKEKKGYYVNPHKYYKYQPSLKFEVEKREYLYDFTSETISSDLMGIYTLRKCAREVLEEESAWLSKSSFRGDEELRESLSNYLYQYKGMNITKDNVVVVSSLEESLNIIDSLIKVERLGVEEYAYQSVRKYYEAKGKEICYFKLDSEGVIIDKDVDLLFVTPYNQFPLGIITSSTRKNDILKSNCNYILEDDYDCDLINNKKMVLTLYSMDNERVFYHGFLSHFLAPSLRVNYLVIPSRFVNAISKINKPNSISLLDQKIINKYLSEGHYFRYLTKLKKECVRRKNIIFNYLKSFDFLNIKENELSFIIKIKESFDKELLVNLLEKNQIKIKFLSEYTFLNDNRLVLFFLALDSEKLLDGLKVLVSLIQESIKK